MTTTSPEPGAADRYEADPVTAWAEDVVAGRIVAGPHVRDAAARHLRDLVEGPARGLVWDVATAKNVIGWFARNLRLNGGQFEGRPFVLHPSQAFRVGSLFGWKWKATGLRRFRRFYDEEGKGNGKSPMLGGIGLYLMVADGEARAEVYSAAAKKDQARILFQDAVAMVEQSPRLTSRIDKHGVEPVWQLSYRGKDGGRRIFKPIANEAKSGGQSGPGRMVRSATRCTSILRATPSTCWSAGSNSANSPCSAWRPTAAPTASRSAGRSISTPSGWQPASSRTIPPSRLSARWTRTTTGKTTLLLGQGQPAAGRHGDRGLPGAAGGPGEEDAGQAQRHRPAAFLRMDAGADRGDPARGLAGLPRRVRPARHDRRGLSLFRGLDLSQTRDFTALTLVWLLDATRDAERFRAATWFWTPQDTLADRAAADQTPYLDWVRDGHIEAVPGERLKYAWLADAIARINAEFAPQIIGCDQYGLERLQENLQDIGAVIPAEIHPQGFQSGCWKGPEGA